jgi:hypothetical protein
VVRISRLKHVCDLSRLSILFEELLSHSTLSPSLLTLFTAAEIFKLRYKVMVKDVKVNPFPPDHYCIKGDEFSDDYDFLPSTGHCLVRFHGQPVASSRIVNGNFVPLEAEKYGWVDVRAGIKPFVKDPKNIAEPCRVVADRSVRGSNVVPLMYLHCLEWFIESKIENFVGMVNTEAKPLIEHYSKWAKCKWINDKPFLANDFIAGRKLDYCIVSVGKPGTPEHDEFIIRNYSPAFLAWWGLKGPTKKD